MEKISQWVLKKNRVTDCRPANQMFFSKTAIHKELKWFTLQNTAKADKWVTKMLTDSDQASNSLLDKY